MLSYSKTLQRALLISILINLVLVLIVSFMYTPLLQMPHGSVYILEVLGMLFLYLLFVIRFTSSNPSFIKNILKPATIFGLIGATVEVVHISIENFGHLEGKTESLLTGIFMLILFILFFIAGFTGSWMSNSIVTGIVCSIWTVVICMLIVSAYGLSQLLWSFDALARHDIGDPDFIRTGWKDFHAFVIADILEACFKIWLMGPVMGAVLGALGGSIAIVSKRIIRKPEKA